MNDSVVKCNKPPRAAKPPLRRFEVRLVATILLISPVILVASMTVPLWEQVVVDKNHEVTQITVLRPEITKSLNLLWFPSVLAVLAVGIWLCVRKRLALGIGVILFATIAVPSISVICTFMINPAPWTTQAEIVGPDGRTYYFMDSSFLQGQTMALTYLNGEEWLTRTMKVLGINNGDSPRSWASVIRPEDAPEKNYGQLYFSEAGLLVGIRYDHKCFLAYELKSGKFFGHEDVEELSPFVLMGPATIMHQPDVEATIREITRKIKFFLEVDDIRHTARYLRDDETFPGYPRSKTLTAGLNHPNPAVRQVAERLLRMHRDGIEKARARVANP